MKNIICDECGKNTANVYYKQTINGKTEERNLCSECAEKLGIKNAFNFKPAFASIFDNFFSDSFFGLPMFGTNKLSDQSTAHALKGPGAACPVCHSTISDITNSGRFGCGNCYSFFSEYLDTNSLTKGEHKGKRPLSFLRRGEKKAEVKQQPATSENKNAQKLSELKAKIKKAIADEDYESAAKLRDEIRSIENEGK